MTAAYRWTPRGFVPVAQTSSNWRAKWVVPGDLELGKAFDKDGNPR